MNGTAPARRRPRIDPPRPDGVVLVAEVRDHDPRPPTLRASGVDRRSWRRPFPRLPLVRLASLAAGAWLVGGCAVVAVVDTVGTVAVKTVGVAADAAIGTAKIVGKGVGKAADATLGSDKDTK